MTERERERERERKEERKRKRKRKGGRLCVVLELELIRATRLHANGLTGQPDRLQTSFLPSVEIHCPQLIQFFEIFEKGKSEKAKKRERRERESEREREKEREREREESVE